MTSQVGESIQTVVVVCVEAFPPYRDSLCGGDLEYLEDSVEVKVEVEVEVKVEVKVEVEVEVEVKMEVKVEVRWRLCSEWR